MKSKGHIIYQVGAILVTIMLVLFFQPPVSLTGSGIFDSVQKADAADGKGNPNKGQGSGQKGGADAGKGGSGEGSKQLQDSVLRGGQGSAAVKKGSGGGSSSSTLLGRLSMARAYMSPSFDPSKIDDPEAPLAYLDAYKTALEDSGTTPVTLEQLATYLAGVATAAITGESVLEVNSILQVTDLFTATGISADDLATRVNELVKENREE